MAHSLRIFRLALSIMAGTSALACLASPPPERVDIPSMRTSIYVGSVTLTLSPLNRDGDSYAASYEARIIPWFFWNENGSFSIAVPEADVDRLRRGETVEFTGDATNHRGKPRVVTGRARPTGPGEGAIKIRIKVDGMELVFNGEYDFVDS